ncbi:MAG: hypothetical protein AM324_001840 [Candidatus Thorarchaeota archaeon SMTZ1-83]|nr:MAG: hypothetical protein AM324_02750 [Candidatus Thorarchaeota archaeon SMTZ1-83]
MRRLVGRILFWIGVIIIGAVLVLGVAVISVSALSGSNTLAVDYSNYATPFFIIGILIMMIGLMMALFPDGFSRDGLWVLKLGPFVR